MIIDADGKVWDDASSLLRGKLGCARAGLELSDFAVRKLGYVALRHRGPRTVEVRHLASVAKPMALLQAVQWLGGRNWDRIILVSWLGEQQTYCIGDLAETIPYLMGLAMAAQSTRQRDFEAHRHAPSAVAKDAAFARVQAAWRAARGVKDRGLIEAVTEASCGRTLEVVPQQGASRLVLDAVGTGYNLYGRGWKSVAVGGRFEDMPDYEYAQWAAQGYREAFRAGEPIFEDITAAIRLPRSGRFRLTYRRVILPIGGGEHPDLLLGATLNQSVTPVDLEPIDKFADVVQ